MLQSVPQTAGAGIAKVISTSAFTPMGRPSGSPMMPGASAGFFPTRPPAPFSRRRALITAPSSARSAARVFRVKVNPCQARRFAEAAGKRAKTGKAGAAMLARFGAARSRPCVPWQTPSATR
jgi:hypothetical protein